MPVVRAAPRGMRLPRIRRPGAWFALAAILAVGAFLLARGAGQSAAPGERVLVAARPVAPGTLISADDPGLLTMAQVPAGSVLPGMLRSADDALGRRAAAAITAGEPITQAALGGDPRIAPAPLGPGERAMPVPLRAAGVAAAAPVPGARVDVLASDGEGLAGRTRVVVSDAEVLAVMRADPADGDVGGDAIVLRITSDQALEVTRALDFAREVRVVARPAGDP